MADPIESLGQICSRDHRSQRRLTLVEARRNAGGEWKESGGGGATKAEAVLEGGGGEVRELLVGGEKGGGRGEAK